MLHTPPKRDEPIVIRPASIAAARGEILHSHTAEKWLGWWRLSASRSRSRAVAAVGIV